MRNYATSPGSELWRIALLGVNAWVVALLLPSLHVGLTPLQALATSAPLLVLGAGVLAHRRANARAPWVLLAGFPAALGAVLAGRQTLIERDAYGPLGLIFAALSLLAFAAASAHASARDLRSAPAQASSPLGRSAVLEPPARRWTRRALLGLSGVGALALALLAPVLTQAERFERWGEAADDATVLAAVVGTIAGCLALGAVVGPSLRADRARPLHPAHRQRRLGAAILLAVAAGVGWLLLRHFDALAGA